MSGLLYGCTTWTLTKHMEKKLDGNCTKMLRAVLNKSWWQHFTKQQLYGHQPPISKTIQILRTRHARYCWRSEGAFISEILPWTTSHRCVCVGGPARTYLQQLCTDTGRRLEDVTGTMDDKDEWQERTREIHASGTTWYIYICSLFKKNTPETQNRMEINL